MSYAGRRLIIPLLAVLIALTTTPMAHGESLDDSTADPHVRTAERQLSVILTQGTIASPYLRELVARLNNSDVVVYMQTDMTLTNYTGKMTFMAVSGGRRYVVVTVAWGQTTQRLIVTIAHELRHAIEVADDPRIVDDHSLARAYQRIGFPSVRQTSTKSAYETHAALGAGDLVWQEINDRTRSWY